MWYVYIARSEKDGGVYIGMSENPEKRIKGHNSGQTQSTKGRRPLVLVHKESVGARKLARERGKWFKSGDGREWIYNTIINPG